MFFVSADPNLITGLGEVTADRSATTFKVEWTNPTQDPPSGYQILIDNYLLGTEPAASTSYVFNTDDSDNSTALKPGTNYNITVKSVGLDSQCTAEETGTFCTSKHDWSLCGHDIKKCH